MIIVAIFIIVPVAILLLVTAVYLAESKIILNQGKENNSQGIDFTINGIL